MAVHRVLEALERRLLPNRATQRRAQRTIESFRGAGGWDMTIDMLDAGVLPPTMAARVRRSIGE